MPLESHFKKNRPKDPRKILRDVEKQLTRFAAEFQRQVSKYPPDNPPARYYRRTGDLGRFWVSSSAVSGIQHKSDGLSISIVNRVRERRRSRRPYAWAVQGGPNQQARLMAYRGWEMAITIGVRVWNKYKIDLQKSIKQV